MRVTNEELRELYQEDTARKHQQGQCLPSELMARAAAGEVDSSERGQIAAHLMTCSDCASEYRNLSTLRSWSETAAASVIETPRFGTDRPSDLSRHDVHSGATQSGLGQRLKRLLLPFRAAYAAAALLLLLSMALGIAFVLQRRENQRLAAQLNKQPTEVTVVPSPERLESMRRQLEEETRRADGAEAARAAAQKEVEELARRLGAGSVGGKPSPPTRSADAEIAELRRSVDSLSQPQVNVPIIDVDPQGSTRAQSGSLATIEVPSAANLFTLILHVTGQPSHPVYDLLISNERGATVWRGRGLRKSPHNTFTVALPRRLFPGGQYRIKLSGLQDGRQEPVEEYAIRIQYR